jgi:hypothetical protein
LESGIGDVTITDLSIDEEEQTLVFVGTFRGGLELTPGANIGGTPNSTYRSFIAQYDLNGSYLAATVIGASQEAVSLVSVAIDIDHDIIVGGGLSGPVDIDPNGTTVLQGGNWSAFMAKYTIPFDLVWGVNFTGSVSAAVNDLHVRADGALLIAGHGKGSSVDLDPGPASSATNFGSASDYRHGFFASYAPGLELEWAQVLGSAGCEASVGTVLTDAEGSVYLLGKYDRILVGSVMDLDPGPGTNAMLDYRRFVAKYTGAGEHQWGYAMPDGTSTLRHFNLPPVDGALTFISTFNSQASGNGYLYDSAGPILSHACQATYSDSPFAVALDTEGAVVWYAYDAATCAQSHWAISLAGNAQGDRVMLGNYNGTHNASLGSGPEQLPVLQGTHPYLMKFNINDISTAVPALSDNTDALILVRSAIIDPLGRRVREHQAPATLASRIRDVHQQAELMPGAYLLVGTSANGEHVSRKFMLVR